MMAKENRITPCSCMKTRAVRTDTYIDGYNQLVYEERCSSCDKLLYACIK